MSPPGRMGRKDSTARSELRADEVRRWVTIDRFEHLEDAWKAGLVQRWLLPQRSWPSA
jgi:hypothetical protein